MVEGGSCTSGLGIDSTEWLDVVSEVDCSSSGLLTPKPDTGALTPLFGADPGIENVAKVGVVAVTVAERDPGPDPFWSGIKGLFTA